MSYNEAMLDSLEQVLHNPKHRYYFFVSDALAIVTIISIVSLVLETVPSLQGYAAWFVYIEWVAVTIFVIEYLARTVVSQPKPWSYTFSFFGFVDLLSVVPSFLGAGNLTFLKAARSLRIIRLLRVLKIFKDVQAHTMHESLSTQGLSTLIYCTMLGIGLLLFGTLIYVAENGAASFTSIPAGMWWSLQVFAGGMPVAQPTTELGTVVYVLGRFSGFVLIGVLIGVVGTLFRTRLLRED